MKKPEAGRSIRVARFASTTLVAALCVGLSGCASSPPPAQQTIRLQTPGCATATCELSNDRGSWHLSRAPGSVTVSVSREPLKVMCRADEAVTGHATARSSRPATSGAGAVAGGLTGGAVTGVALGATALAFIPPLGAIAVLTGAGAGAAVGAAADSHLRSLRYPDFVSIPMRCAAVDGGAPATGPSGPRLGLVVRGLTLAEAQAAGLFQRTAVLVISVVAGARAGVSGVRAGDVILGANGQDLADAADLEERLLAMPPGVPLALQLWRDRQAVDLVLTPVPEGGP